MIRVEANAIRGDFRLYAKISASGPATVLFGASGSGKSTFASLVAGLVRPAQGKVEIDGVRVADTAAGLWTPPARRRVGYVFQDALLFPHMSVRDNLLYGARRHRLEAPPLEATVEMLGLTPLLDRRPQGLSGGESRRVAIGRALLSAPRLLILDEPLAGLDGAMRSEILHHVENLVRDGPPVLYITHSVEEAARLADEVLLVADGKVFNAGPPDRAFAHPLAEQAAGLNAPISVLEGRAMPSLDFGSPTVVDLGGTLFHTPPLSAAPGARVRIVVDARDVALALNDPPHASFQNRIAMTVTDVRRRPDGVLINLQAPGLTLRSLVTNQAVANLDLAPSRSVIALIKAVALSRPV